MCGAQPAAQCLRNNAAYSLWVVVAGISQRGDAVADPAEGLRVPLAVLLPTLDVVARG